MEAEAGTTDTWRRAHLSVSQPVGGGLRSAEPGAGLCWVLLSVLLPLCSEVFMFLLVGAAVAFCSAWKLVLQSSPLSVPGLPSAFCRV